MEGGVDDSGLDALAELGVQLGGAAAAVDLY